jgi:hypothetical protein
VTDIIETQVHDALRQQLSRIAGIKLLGWNPPNSKTYGLPNILIPKFIGKRRAGSDRVDACVGYYDLVMLVEIKPLSSLMEGDIAKLRRICSYYGLDGILQILRRQGVHPDNAPTCLVPTIAFGALDSSLPEDFLCWQISQGVYRQVMGPELPEGATKALRVLKPVFEKRPGSP